VIGCEYNIEPVWFVYTLNSGKESSFMASHGMISVNPGDVTFFPENDMISLAFFHDKNACLQMRISLQQWTHKSSSSYTCNQDSELQCNVW
jgi:hypothetical protein